MEFDRTKNIFIRFIDFAVPFSVEIPSNHEIVKNVKKNALNIEIHPCWNWKLLQFHEIDYYIH